MSMESHRSLPVPLPHTGSVTFNVVLRGYERPTVDVLVSEIERALALTDTPARAGAAADFEARGRELPVVRRGYDRSQVNAYLNEMVRHLRS